MFIGRTRAHMGYVVTYSNKISETRYIAHVTCNKSGFLHSYILGNARKEYYMHLNDIDKIIMNNFSCISHILTRLHILEASLLYLRQGKSLDIMHNFVIHVVINFKKKKGFICFNHFIHIWRQIKERVIHY